jgi:hypothetical protein
MEEMVDLVTALLSYFVEYITFGIFCNPLCAFSLYLQPARHTTEILSSIWIHSWSFMVVANLCLRESFPRLRCSEQLVT